MSEFWYCTNIKKKKLKIWNMQPYSITVINIYYNII